MGRPVVSPARKRSRELVAVPSSAWVSRAPWHFPSLSEDKASDLKALSRAAATTPPVFYPDGALDQAEYEMVRELHAQERRRVMRDQAAYDRAAIGGGYDWDWYKATQRRPAGDPAAVLPLPGDLDLDQRVDALMALYD